MNESNEIFVSGINPFDSSYDSLQRALDQQVIQLLIELLKLNVTVQETPLITRYDSYVENPNNWIVEQIVNGSAEISSSTLILTADSHSLVTYSFAIGSFRPELYYKATSIRENSNIYMIPFSINLWLSFIITVFLLVLTLIIILTREAKLPHKISYDVLARIIDIQEDGDLAFSQDVPVTSKEILLQKEKWEMGEILLSCFGAVCQQGSARDPSTNAARILTLCLFVLALFGYTAFSASLISLVSLYPSTKLEYIRNINCFANKYKTILFGTYNAQYMQNFKLEVENIEHTDLKKGFDKVFQDQTVLIDDKDISLTFLNNHNSMKNKCSLGRIFLGLEYHRVLALKKTSKYKEKINYSILQLKQFGLLNRERKKIYNTKSPCSSKEKISAINYFSFNQKDVKPITDLFLFGIFLSFLMLIIEKAYYIIKTFIVKN